MVSALLVVLLMALSACGKNTGPDHTSEGTILAPVVLPPAKLASTPVTWSGTVGSVHSYYQVEIDPALKYLVTLRGLSADADLFIYAAPGFVSNTAICASVLLDTNTEVCDWSGTGVEAVPLVAPLGQLYILVKAVDPQGAVFTLEVVPKAVVP
ncbi:MAG: hypothetical protein OEW39_12230 [Deltaproteobacteria bacterium]|nr:hypothetical protein [Deltaproteobacteria bacterium]